MKQINVSTKKYPYKYAIVDDESFVSLNQYKWWINKHGYAVRKKYTKSSGYGKGDHTEKQVLMHVEINNTPRGQITDHVNRNRLDNRKCNLRISSKSQNGLNINTKKNNTSGYTGVHWYKPYKMWQAYITINYKRRHLGYFKNIIDALVARKKVESCYL